MILSSKFALVPDSGSSHHDQLHSWRGYVALGIASFRKRFISPRPGVYTVSQLTNPRRMFTESSIVGDLVAVDGPERKGEIVAEEMKIGLCEKKEEKKVRFHFVVRGKLPSNYSMLHNSTTVKTRDTTFQKLAKRS